MKRQNAIRILVADDHKVVRMGIVAMLESEPTLQVVAQSETGEAAVELYREHRPDVAVIDLRMPGIGGFEAIRRICADFSGARILVLTTSDGDEDIHRALQAGASGYLFKDADDAELSDAVLAVHNGEQYLPAAVRQKLAEREDGQRISERELEVLNYLAKGLSNREIGNLIGVTERTVKFHVRNLTGKLGASDRTEAVSRAFNRGVLHLDQ